VGRYGLIGIAIDADAHFPMRYGTPLTQVYAALLDYQNKKYAKSQKYGSHRGMLEFCQLVGEALQLDVEKGQGKGSPIPMFLWDFPAQDLLSHALPWGLLAIFKRWGLAGRYDQFPECNNGMAYDYS